MTQIRSADVADIERLASIWHDGWHEAHARIMPDALTRLRTPDSFVHRVAPILSTLRVVGPLGAPVGLCATKDDELYQLYVAPVARGTGVAAALLADGEARLRAAAVTTAWLACGIGNDRAAHFYEKHGWRRAGTMVFPAETSQGIFPVDVWRYEKAMKPSRT
jgi:GNAT superfamily N-acetyltransferase